MLYNLTKLTSTDGSYATMFCESSLLSNDILAYTIIIVILILSIYFSIKKGYTIYTALPVSFFGVACFGTLLWAIRCSGQNMLGGRTVVILWFLTATFIGIRKMIGE